MVVSRSIIRAVVFAAAFATTYVLLVHVESGQLIDAESFGAFRSVNLAVGGAAGIFRTSVAILLAVAAAAAGAGALIQRRFSDVVRAVLVIVVSVGLSEVMKDVLPRPNLGDYGYAANTFPSGHVALALSAAVAVTILVPLRARAVIGSIVMIAALGVAWASVVSFAHRPSDVIGGALVVGLVVALVNAAHPGVLDGRPVLTLLVLATAVASTVLVVLASGAPHSPLALAGWLLLSESAVALVAGSLPARGVSNVERQRRKS